MTSGTPVFLKTLFIALTDSPGRLSLIGTAHNIFVKISKVILNNFMSINSSYDVIAKRKGKMQNGTFVKSVHAQHKVGGVAQLWMSANVER